MSTSRYLLTVTLVFLCASAAVAHNEARSNGTLLEQTPCAPSPVSTYEQYREAFQRFQTREVEAAKREGFRMEIPIDIVPQLVSREEFERRRASAKVTAASVCSYG